MKFDKKINASLLHYEGGEGAEEATEGNEDAEREEQVKNMTENKGNKIGKDVLSDEKV